MTNPQSNSLKGVDAADDAENDAYRAELTLSALKRLRFLIQRDNLPDRLTSTRQRSNSPQA